MSLFKRDRFLNGNLIRSELLCREHDVTTQRRANYAACTATTDSCPDPDCSADDPGVSVWAQGGGEVKHTVQAGENLYRIALDYGTTVEAIAQANGITNPNLIFVGQVLTIPEDRNACADGDAGSDGHGDDHPARTPVVTPVVTPPHRAGEIVHVVQAGENLFRISLKYNLLTSIVAAYNGIANPNLIYVGQKIRIPSGTAAVAAVSTPGPTATPGSGGDGAARYAHRAADCLKTR